MKTIFILGMLSVASVLPAQTLNQALTNASAMPAPTPYAVVSQDANSAVWQREIYEPAPDGSAVPHIQSYTELATGLNHLVNGQWVASSENIVISADGSSAVATNGQHQAYFPGDIYNGEIQLVTPDGKQLQSQPIGLSYFDGTNSVLLAELTNSTGEILPSGNQVIYTNAFAGLDADLLYTYTKAGFEQDVILREQPPDPGSLGLNPQATRLQVLTEFFNPPQPSVTATTLPTAAGNLEDDSLNFGVMQMVPGKAFLLGTNSPSVTVNKQWLLINNRQFLVEEVPIVSIAPEIDTLPPFVSQTGLGTKTVVSKKLLLPRQRLTHTSPQTTFLTKATPPNKGLVLDYVTMTSQTNWTFQGDTTYYISGSVNLHGTTTIEGGTVVKYTNGATINVAGPVNCQTGPYRPAIFTAKDDDSAGQPITGSTGNPTGVYAGTALALSDTCMLQYLRIGYANYGISTMFCALTNKDSQFINVANPFSCQYGYSEIENVLIDNAAGTVISVSYHGMIAQNLTVHDAATFCSIYDGGLNVTNSLLISCTNLGSSFGGAYNYTNSSDTGIFQTVGAGANYLATNCPSGILDAGTTNIDPALLADLQDKTTWPPTVYTNVTFTSNITWSPQAPRDTNVLPDLGYHYDPLDYVFGGCTANSNITFTAGTAVGWFRTSSGYYSPGHHGQGLYIHTNVVAAFQGTEEAPDYWVRLNTVQESDTSAGSGPGGLTGGDDDQYNYQISGSAEVHLTFTHCSILAGELGDHFRDDWGYLIVRANDCEFYGSGIEGYIISCYFTNCFMGRMVGGQVAGWPGDKFIMRNCTYIGGGLGFSPYQTNIPISIRDCAFEGTAFTISSYGSGGTNDDYDYNAFTNGMTQFSGEGTNYVTVTNFNWQSSWLGNYYLPPSSPLLNAGDVPASQLGLYHFTIQTNQVPEGTNIVSIGYHYVAVDQYGNPLDSNGDGIPDYLEDANGDGIYDTGDLGDWQNLNLNVIITRPRNGGILP